MDPIAPASTAFAGTATPPVPHERHRSSDERHYRRLADAGVCGVIFWTLDGPLLEANDEFLRMCGHTRDDLDAGLLDWRTMTPPEWVEVDQRYLAALLEQGMHQPYEKECYRKDGSRVPVLVGSACFEETSDRGVSFILDLSDRKRASADAAFLAEASAALATSLDHTATLSALARTAVPAFADACVVDLLADGDRAERVASAYRDPELERLARALDTRTPPSPDAAYGPWRVLRTGVPQLVPVVTDEVISEVAREATHRVLVEQLQLRSLLSVPILSDGRVAGALTFLCDARGARRHDARDLPVALELAHRASVAMDHARLYAAERVARERAERAADRTARLQRVAEALGGTLTTEEARELIVRQGLEALGADVSFVARLTEDRQALEVTHAEGYEAAFLASFTRFPLDADLPAAIAARSARALWVDAHDELADLAGWQVRDALPAHVVIPLVAEGQVLGVIGFGFREPHTFAADDKVFLEALSQLYVQSLRRAELLEAERRARALAERAARRAAFLAEASRALATSLEVETTLRTVARHAVPAIADWCAIDLLVVPRRPTLPGEPARDWPPEVQRLVVAHADPARFAGAHELPERSPRDWTRPTGLPRVMREGVTEFHPVIDDIMLVAAAHGEEEMARLREIDLAASIIAPLLSRGRILGAVTLCMRESRRRYEDADRLLAEDLASRVAATIENAALFHDVATANRAKADFLAVISHEIRTPINAMLGYTDLLDAGVSGALSEAQRTYVQRAREAARRLLGHVEDVLMFARLEAGHVAVQVGPVTVRELLEAVVPVIAPEAAARHLALEVAVADGLEVRADRDRAVQVLLNLLSNAIKFTPGGGRVRLVSERPARGVVALHVQDTGPGIPPEKREVVFEPFVQLDTSHTRRAGGTGLGLAISRDLARAMGGEIAIGDGGAEVGATFTFLLPEAEPASVPDESAPSGRPPT